MPRPGAWGPVLETHLILLPLQSQQECLEPRWCWGGFQECSLPTVAVSAMKRKVPDAGENGESKVNPHIPVARGQAKGVSGWSVCGCKPCKGRLEAPSCLVQGPCSAKGPGARGGYVGRGGVARAGWEQGGPTGWDGGAGEGRRSTNQDRAVGTEAKEGACLWGCRGPAGQELAQEGILAEAGRAVWNTGAGCKGSAPKHAARHSVT